MSSSGTEFLIRTGNQLKIKSIYDNTNIFIHINEDYFPDYIISLNSTDDETIINPEWKIKAGSKIISTKPIIIRELSKKIEFTGKGIIQKIYCVLPDTASYRKEYLLEKGKHTIISSTDNTIKLYNLKHTLDEIENQNNTFILKKNIPLEIILTENKIIKSKNNIIAYNEYCINPISSNIFYLPSGEHHLFPTINNQIIYIDYNSDGFFDTTINTKNNSKIIINSSSGTKIFSNISFFLRTEIKNEDNFMKFQFTLNGITKKIKEYIVGLFDEQLNEYHLKISKIGPILNNQTYINKNKKINNLIKYIALTEESIGYEMTDLFKSKSYHSFSGEAIIPQMSSVEFSKGTLDKIKIIRIFNPKKSSNYLNLTINITCKYEDINCLKNINLHYINTDEKIADITIDDNNNYNNYEIIYLEKLDKETYVEIEGQDIIRYSITAYEE